MEAPTTVTIEESGSDTSGYRDAADDRRRDVRVRGSSPTRSIVLLSTSAILVASLAVGFASRPDLLGNLFVLAIVPVGTLFALGPPVVWRRLQWARFEVARRRLTTHTGPLGSKTNVEAWSARTPFSVVREGSWGRPLVNFRTWDLYVERDDGRRVLLATLHDEESLAYVTQFLVDTYRDAEPNNARHPFAVRFGPMPDGVSCEGDLDDPSAGWQLDVRCPRGSLASEVGASIGLLVLSPFMLVLVVLALVATVGGLLQEFDRGMALCAAFGMAMLMGVAGAFCFALRDQLRTTILRWRGHVWVDLTPDGIDLHTTPWRVRAIPAPRARAKGPIRLEVTPLARNRAEAKLEVVHAGRAKRLHAPLSTDDAHYVAKIVQAYESSRTA